MGKHRERKQEEQQDQAYYQGQQSAMATAPAPAASGGITSQDTERLAELGKLHDQGILTDDEFSQQKARSSGPADRLPTPRQQTRLSSGQGPRRLCLRDDRVGARLT